MAILPTTVSERHIPLAAVRDAASAIYRAATRTPLVRLGDTNVYLKLEVLQPIGSFKIRGAYNVIRQLTPDELAGGVWTVSAGNAAQGVALAARQVGARSYALRQKRGQERQGESNEQCEEQSFLHVGNQS